MTKTKKPVVFAVIQNPVKVTLNDVRSLLCSAFESGTVNYWVHDMEEMILPKEYVAADVDKGGKLNSEPDDYWHWSQLLPTIAGGGIKLKVTSPNDNFVNEYGPQEGKPSKNGISRVILNQAKLIRGLEVMQQIFPQAWSDFVSENADGNTADVFLQCSLFPDLVLKAKDSIFS